MCPSPTPDPSELRRLQDEHTPEAIQNRLAAGPQHSYLRDFVYGAIDGAVTTFAIVSGVAGAGLSAGIVIVMGLANLLGDGFSMAASNYLGTKAENQIRNRMRRTEERHIRLYPEGEREEIRQIVASKGFEGDDLERAVEIITSDRERWIDTMMREELGLSSETTPAWKAALTTFLAFIAIGMIPLIAFLLDFFQPGLVHNLYAWSTALTGVAFFSVGAIKSYFVDERWFVAGGETLLVGSLAAGLAYLVGYLFRGML